MQIIAIKLAKIDKNGKIRPVQTEIPDRKGGGKEESFEGVCEYVYRFNNFKKELSIM